MSAKHAPVEDPAEIKVAEILSLLGIEFVRERQDNAFTKGLDFRAGDVFFEVKQFPTERTSDQVARVENVVLFQGMPAIDMILDAVRQKINALNAANFEIEKMATSPIDKVETPAQLIWRAENWRRAFENMQVRYMQARDRVAELENSSKQ
jgi:hypothetical protein